MDEHLNWPGWEKVRKIGEGGFGAVYEIQRNVFGTIEKAALKVISIPHNESDVEDLIGDGYDVASIAQTYQNHLESIVKEYSLMAAFKGNSNIVDCDDLMYLPRENGYGWDILIKMELLTPLTKSLGKSITEEQIIMLGIDICNALVLCKSKNIVHRDIKPQNIFISEYGQYKLGDFGIAKVAEKTSSGTKTGTYNYMAPEIYNNQPYGTAADIYSLGMVLYWMLNERRLPFLPLPPQVPTVENMEEARQRRCGGEPIPKPAHGCERLKEIVLKACAFDQAERYSDAAQMRDDLKKLLAQQDEAEVSRVEKTEERSKRVLPRETTEVEDETKTIAAPRLVDLPNEPGRKAPERIEPEKKQLSKKGSKMKVLIPIIAGLLVIAVVVVVLLGGNKASEDQTVKLPTERVMTSDAASILKNEDIEGGITSLYVVEAVKHEKYQTYVATCEISVKAEDENQKYTVTLVYEQNDDEWVLSNLSELEQ